MTTNAKNLVSNEIVDKAWEAGCTGDDYGHFAIWDESQLRKAIEAVALMLDQLIAEQEKAEAVPTDLKLDAPALVGHTSFGKGIPWKTVIECAQRHFEWKDDPKATPEQIAEFRDVLLNSAAIKVSDEIMAQAQTFASAWSLVGSRFDDGNALHNAEAAKEVLRELVKASIAPMPAQAGDAVSKRQLSPQDDAMGAWLSAALSDSRVCYEMKRDIHNWMDQFQWSSSLDNCQMSKPHDDGKVARDALPTMSDSVIDRHLDNVLKASGSALRNYPMAKTIAAMRVAMRRAIGVSDPSDKAIKEQRG
jgi:hypothetical protein